MSPTDPRHPGRRNDDMVTYDTAKFLKRWGPVVAFILGIAGLGSCALVGAQAFGFTPTTAGARLDGLEARVEVNEKAIQDERQDARMVKLFLCSSNNINDTQREICADWNRRRTR